MEVETFLFFEVSRWQVFCGCFFVFVVVVVVVVVVVGSGGGGGGGSFGRVVLELFCAFLLAG